MKRLPFVGQVRILVGNPICRIFYFLITFIVFSISLIGNITLKVIKKIRKIFKISFKFIKVKRLKFAIPVLIILLCILFYFKVLKDLPNAKDLSSQKPQSSTKIYDRNGILLYQIFKDENRSLVKLDDLPSYVTFATIASEDSEFMNHHGVSLKGMFRAILDNIKFQKLSGGSTITQQLVKNTLLTPEKTLTRKLKEIVLALIVENSYSKKEILEMYLNEIGFGGNVYGIEEASLTFFGKNAKDLSLPEAALLAGLPQSPTQFSPFLSPNLALDRKNYVLSLMKSNGFIKEDEYQKALNEKLTFAKREVEIKAPHFVMYVKDELVKKYGEDEVEKGGLEVRTTLDYKIQQISEKAVRDEIDKVRNLNVKNAASVVVNPKNGEILAMVGSYDYFDTKNDGNVNLVTSLRQPGSSIKVVNYAYALSHGYTPATILVDEPVSFLVSGQPVYTPVDYDSKFRGKISLRSALAESRNIPAVKVLASNGVDKMIWQGQKMGISTWNDPSNYGLSLTLGGGEVKLIDLANVYATIANYGTRPEIKSIISVKDYKSQILEENQDNTSKEVVLDPRVAFMLIDILKDNFARSPAFGSNSALVIKDHPNIAVKTGTSNDLKDNLTVGFNKDYVVATWVGNNDNSQMSRIASGITGASPIWNSIMTSLVFDKPDGIWPIPQGLTQMTVCSKTGTLPCSGCATKVEWFKVESAPKSCDFKNLAEINLF